MFERLKNLWQIMKSMTDDFFIKKHHERDIRGEDLSNFAILIMLIMAAFYWPTVFARLAIEFAVKWFASRWNETKAIVYKRERNGAMPILPVIVTGTVFCLPIFIYCCIHWMATIFVGLFFTIIDTVFQTGDDFKK